MAKAEPLGSVNGVAITTDDMLLFVAAIGAYQRLHPQIRDDSSARVLLAYEVAQRQGHQRALALLSRVEALTALLHDSHLTDWSAAGSPDESHGQRRAAVFAAAAAHPLVWTARGYAFEHASFLSRVRRLMASGARDAETRQADEDERGEQSPA